MAKGSGGTRINEIHEKIFSRLLLPSASKLTNPDSPPRTRPRTLAVSLPFSSSETRAPLRSTCPVRVWERDFCRRRLARQKEPEDGVSAQRPEIEPVSATPLAASPTCEATASLIFRILFAASQPACDAGSANVSFKLATSRLSWLKVSAKPSRRMSSSSERAEVDPSEGSLRSYRMTAIAMSTSCWKIFDRLAAASARLY